MKVKYLVEGGQHKAYIDGDWNALSLFLETDSVFHEAVKHVTLRERGKWMGNTTTIEFLEGSRYVIYSELEIELSRVEIYEKQFMLLLNAWRKFKSNGNEITVTV